MEDDLGVAAGLESVLSEEGYKVNLTDTGKLALEAFEQKCFDLLVADLRLPDIDGMEIIRQIKVRKPEIEVIVITGYGTPATAVKAMKLGAHDFLPKPFTEGQIKTAINEALAGYKQKPVETVVKKAKTKKEKLIQKQEVHRVLSRTAEDQDFWSDLIENRSFALADHPLSCETKAAIASGDIEWINENVAGLTRRQLMFVYKRLEREAW
jgi:DNA-binding NtrC family response regulator